MYSTNTVWGVISDTAFIFYQTLSPQSSTIQEQKRRHDQGSFLWLETAPLEPQISFRSSSSDEQTQLRVWSWSDKLCFHISTASPGLQAGVGRFWHQFHHVKLLLLINSTVKPVCLCSNDQSFQVYLTSPRRLLREITSSLHVQSVSLTTSLLLSLLLLWLWCHHCGKNTALFPSSPFNILCFWKILVHIKKKTSPVKMFKTFILYICFSFFL